MHHYCDYIRFDTDRFDAMPVGSSLKGYIPALARHLGTTPAALYERQRALVRAGLLDLGEGRGPGSGVRTTGSSVALLIISELASDRLSDADVRARAISDTRPTRGDLSPEGNPRCWLTQREDFLGALASLLARTGGANNITAVSVSRTADRAEIWFQGSDGVPSASYFEGPNHTEPHVSVKATISGEVFASIAGDVLAIISETFPPLVEGEQT